MDVNSSQSSCEIVRDIAALEVRSETENFSSQFSEIASEVGKLEVAETNLSQTEDVSVDDEEKAPVSSSQSSSSMSSEKAAENSASSESTSSSSASGIEEPAKTTRKRKRKRKKKSKTTTAYSPPKPFLARYKKMKMMEPKVLPKLHIRFDEDCTPDITTSEYNQKPRVIQALTRNLTIAENVRETLAVPPLIEEHPPAEILSQETFICLKPRIIKAIVV